jgi:hypothetical protein
MRGIAMPRLIYGTDTYWLPETFTPTDLNRALKSHVAPAGMALFSLASGERLFVAVGTVPLAVLFDEEDEDDDSNADEGERGVIIL